ncbi:MULTISPECIES: hypothetical protein [Oceanospirillaceae]|jgi:uncharacterized protein YlxW (UPF0749 family)|uniref:hypothetical protein n=1 Tax=Oceanospirillaceae TaxID=135620 RepID=UPI000C3A8CA3|nr:MULTISPECIES: hypothetical protein [Thalassolituus]MBU2038817.1 hypothetical protein [Gammaproteobacteria bacterium]PIQ40621.1 MAG: hypothetical protein COW58_04800 [Thalassolituus sp. CG17_big_fil_post_rev_8_21_14_2_50_53_8]MCB2388600.1 hypothetical protein [Thalassolituus alkanivorans]MCB2423681.1 hypothetical protein [Thalassolituus alkanivorans]TVV42663.1 hypothetical protein FOT50_14400 [Thalassolituus sp. C2-1]
MGLIFAIMAGMIIGGALVAYRLSKRWQQQVKDAEKSLQEIADQHQQEVAAARELKQKVADLQFQLNEARNEVRALQDKQ